jgi:hypothetical protein
MSMKKSDTIGNRTRDLPVCNAVRLPYNPKTLEQDSVCSPQAKFTIWGVSVALFPTFKQNFVANRSSILKSMMRISHTASFHATNHKYCLTHSGITKHTTCRDLLLLASVADRLMVGVVFALQN